MAWHRLQLQNNCLHKYTEFSINAMLFGGFLLVHAVGKSGPVTNKPLNSIQHYFEWGKQSLTIVLLKAQIPNSNSVQVFFQIYALPYTNKGHMREINQPTWVFDFVYLSCLSQLMMWAWCVLCFTFILTAKGVPLWVSVLPLVSHNHWWQVSCVITSFLLLTPSGAAVKQIIDFLLLFIDRVEMDCPYQNVGIRYNHIWKLSSVFPSYLSWQWWYCSMTAFCSCLLTIFSYGSLAVMTNLEHGVCIYWYI